MRIPIMQAYYAPISRPNWYGRRGASLIAVYIVLSAIVSAAPDLRAAGPQPDQEAPEATREAEPDPESDLEIDLEARRSTVEPPLTAAVKARRADAVKVLLAACADPDYCKVFMDTVLEEPRTKEWLTGSFEAIGLEIFDDRELTTFDGGQYRVKEFVTLN